MHVHTYNTVQKFLVCSVGCETTDRYSLYDRHFVFICLYAGFPWIFLRASLCDRKKMIFNMHKWFSHHAQNGTVQNSHYFDDESTNECAQHLSPLNSKRKSCCQIYSCIQNRFLFRRFDYSYTVPSDFALSVVWVILISIYLCSLTFSYLSTIVTFSWFIPFFLASFNLMIISR